MNSNKEEFVTATVISTVPDPGAGYDSITYEIVTEAGDLEIEVPTVTGVSIADVAIALNQLEEKFDIGSDLLNRIEDVAKACDAAFIKHIDR